jgi:hypothetical protein
VKTHENVRAPLGGEQDAYLPLHCCASSLCGSGPGNRDTILICQDYKSTVVHGWTAGLHRLSVLSLYLTV